MEKPPSKLQTLSGAERDKLMANPMLSAIIALIYGAYRFYDLGIDTAHWPYTYAVVFGAIGSIAGIMIFTIEASRTLMSWFGAFAGFCAWVPYLFSLYLMGFLGCYGIYLSFGPFSFWSIVAALAWIVIGYRMLWTFWAITELVVN